jgi:hypothetical protein
MGRLTCGTSKLHVDWGGYRVPLGLPIDPDEARRSDHVVTVDMPLPTWSKTRPTHYKATLRLVNKDTRENGVGSPRPRKRSGPSPNQLCPASQVSDLRPVPEIETHKPSGVHDLSRRDRRSKEAGVTRNAKPEA